MKKISTLILSCLCFASVANSQNPLFPNSIVSTNIDYITATDTESPYSFAYIGTERKEMPGSPTGMLFDDDTYVFEATFPNGKVIGIWCHSLFGDLNSAQGYAEKMAPRLAKLPVLMRDSIRHVVINTGNRGAFAEAQGKFFVISADIMDTRISNNDLEETVFHEAVHVALDLAHIETVPWLAAQNADGNFVITGHAQNRLDKEDLAETAIFTYTMCKHPGRLDANIENWVKTNIPNRHKYILDNIFTNCNTSTSINTNNTDNNIVIYPNPTKDRFFLENAPKQQGLLTITDMNGKIVQEKTITGQEKSFDISNLESAMYMIKIEYQNSNITVSKLLSKE